MQPESDEIVQQPIDASPSTFIRLLAQITTTLHFLESVGATFILWLIPSLAPEPRIHHYIPRSSSTTKVNTNTGAVLYNHHHHRQHILHRHSYDIINREDSPTDRRVQRTSDDSDSMEDRLKEVDWALETGEHIPPSTQDGNQRQRNMD
ncbi:hypothetical protein CPB84DRAFT_1352886 [Gymnopilus junonius]|uniref:Uncharacterized protein n=1 Tax=Gymnopilus junonius TaxID=109634 RepID=A0A9P5NVH6_GYMJU|nr:hypothetical protein CPB84DRAFT_1352886 [Gymnopilus junonius]